MAPKTFYREAKAVPQALFLLGAACMVGFSLYLTSHYYAVTFPEGMTGGSLCDINSFFNCDAATSSPISNIAGVPISLLGVLVGVFALAGHLFPGPGTEGTNRILLLANAGGCLLLLVYSLAFLGGLCPFCALYYAASFLAAHVLWRNGFHLRPHLPTLGAYAAAVLATGFFGNLYAEEQEADLARKSEKLMKGYDQLRVLGPPPFDSEYRLASATAAFADAPIRITKFSDYECPSCKGFSETLHRLSKLPRYRGKINIQYFFYPLDSACNPAIRRPFHRHSCKAAYLSACLPDRFPEVEGEIFSMQKKLSDEWLEKVAKREGVLDCYRSEGTKTKVGEYITAAGAFNVRSTPTWVLNGRKIEGPLPLVSVRALVDGLLLREGT